MRLRLLRLWGTTLIPTIVVWAFFVHSHPKRHHPPTILLVMAAAVVLLVIGGAIDSLRRDPLRIAFAFVLAAVSQLIAVFGTAYLYTGTTDNWSEKLDHWTAL